MILPQTPRCSCVRTTTPFRPPFSGQRHPARSPHTVSHTTDDRLLLDDNVELIKDECNRLFKEKQAANKKCATLEAKCASLQKALEAAVASKKAERAANDTAERELQEHVCRRLERAQSRHCSSKLNAHRAAESRRTGEVHAVAQALRHEEQRSADLQEKLADAQEELQATRLQLEEKQAQIRRLEAENECFRSMF